LKEYYSKHKIQARLVTACCFLIIHLLIINYFIGETNEGKNDAETDAVLLLETTLALLFSLFIMFGLTLYLENQLTWRLILSCSILLIPSLWIVLIVIYGNPLYYYAINY